LGVALDEPQEDETRVKVDDIDLLIANSLVGYADGSSIDYYTFNNRGWFTVERPGHGC